MSTRILLFLALALGASIAPAQTAGVHRGLFAPLFNGPPGTGFLLQLDATNAPSSFATAPSGPWTTWGNAFGAPVDVDNRTVLVPTLFDLGPSRWGLVRWDPVARAVVSTLWSGPLAATSVGNWSNWTINSDGNPVTIDNATTPQALAEYDRFTGTWNRTPLPASVVPYAGLAGLEWDRLHGGYLHAAWGRFGVSPSALYRTSGVPPTTRTLAQTTNNLAQFGGTMTDAGDWYSAADGVAQYQRVPANASSWQLGPAGPGLSDVTAEHFAAPGEGLFVAADDAVRALAYIDVTRNATVVLHQGNASTMPTAAAELTLLGGRDLCSVRTAKGTWDLRIDPGTPALANKTFLCVASILPPTAPIAVPDGREVFIGFDPLMMATVMGPMPPFFTGNIGSLDAFGRASATVDFSSVGGQLNGFVLHFCAIILDPAAPSGIAWVTNPHALEVDVLP